MIRAVGIRRCQCRRTEIAKRLQPLSEDRPHRLVTLQINASNLPRAVVEIVVSGKFVVLRTTRNPLRTASPDQTQKDLVLRLTRRLSKVLRNISLGTK